jgi:F0F1-type ATP synthase epsilon subunit
MAPEDINRSSALSPEMLGMINTMTSTAVSEAVKAVFAGLVPVLQDMALTPEKIQALKAPPIDPAAIAKAKREERENLKSKADEEAARRAERARKDACPHIDKNGRPAICLAHNQPDHQPRGICVVCGDWITPREWRIGPPDEQHPNGKPYLVEPHKDYRIVMQLESMS